MLDLDASLPAELGPLQWLIGDWVGTGVYAWGEDDELTTFEFEQRVSFRYEGLPVLSYSAVALRLGLDETPFATEQGIWRIPTPSAAGPAGPGMAPRTGEAADRDAIEALRRTDGGFDLEASIVLSTGVLELYVGKVDGPRIDLSTDAVVRAASAVEHTASSRMLGLVDGHLLWAWDLAGGGLSMRSHASARLARAQASEPPAGPGPSAGPAPTPEQS